MGTLYVVTGAAGFLGSSVVRELVGQGREVRAFVLPQDSTAKKLPLGVDIVTGDVRSRDDLRRLLQAAPETDLVVIHCAAIVTTEWGYRQVVFEVNVQGTHNVVEQCVEAQVRKLVHVSSVHAIPERPHGEIMTEVAEFDPDQIVGFYGKTKAEASQIVMDAVRQQGLNASIVFPSGLCGPQDHAGGPVTQMLIDGARGRLQVAVAGGYDFVDVRDVAAGVVACCDRGEPGEGYILGNRYVSVHEILGQLHAQTGAPTGRWTAPMWLVKSVLPSIRLYYHLARRPAVINRYALYTLLSNARFSSDKARTVLGYHTRPFAETLADAVVWLRSEGRIPRRTKAPQPG